LIQVLGDDANKVLRGCEDHSFSFALENSATPQDAQDVTLSVSGVVSPPSITQAYSESNNDGDPMKIADVGFSESTISDNSNYPCDLNTITISLRSTVDITAGADCVEYLEIVGLTGTLEPDNQALEVISTSAGVFNADATWEQVDGRIKVYLDANLDAGVTYTFSFEIRNSASPSLSGVTSVDLTVPDISQSITSMTILGAGLLDIMVARAHARTTAHTHIRTRTYAHAHTHTHTHAHAHAHAHAHTLSLSVSFSHTHTDIFVDDFYHQPDLHLPV